MRGAFVLLVLSLAFLTLDAWAQTLAESAAAFPAPSGASFPIWIEPAEPAQVERDIAGLGDTILTFSLRPRSATRLRAPIAKQGMLRLQVDAEAMLNEAQFRGIRAIDEEGASAAYCTQDGALRDIWGNRRWLGCLFDTNADGMFDKWLEVACAANEVTGCNDVPPLTMLLGWPVILANLRTPVAYDWVPQDSVPAYEMDLVLSRGGSALELTARRHAPSPSPETLSARDLAGIPPDGLTLFAYGAIVNVSRRGNGVLHVQIDSNVQRQQAYVQTQVFGFPRRLQQQVIVIAPQRTDQTSH
jgi:hypothetical protein